MLDGEGVLLGVDGISDFNGLHSGRHDEEVQLYAFDILTLDGDDLRKLPLHLRKTNLARLLVRRPEGIFISDFEQTRSVRTCSAKPASSASRAWSPSAATASIAPAASPPGSRIASTRRSRGCRKASREPLSNRARRGSVSQAREAGTNRPRRA